MNSKISLDHSCGGSGSCGTCRVIVHGGLELLPSREDIEREMAESRGFVEAERLACQVVPTESVEVEIPVVIKALESNEDGSPIE